MSLEERLAPLFSTRLLLRSFTVGLLAFGEEDDDCTRLLRSGWADDLFLELLLSVLLFFTLLSWFSRGACRAGSRSGAETRGCWMLGLDARSVSREFLLLRMSVRGCSISREFLLFRMSVRGCSVSREFLLFRLSVRGCSACLVSFRSMSVRDGCLETPGRSLTRLLSIAAASLRRRSPLSERPVLAFTRCWVRSCTFGEYVLRGG